MESKPPIIDASPKRRKTKTIISALTVVAVIFVAYKAYRGVVGASGTAKNVRELASVYRDAGRTFHSFYTNSFLQQMPFTNRIHWGRNAIRPAVFLTSRVDVVEFKRQMVMQAFTVFVESGVSGPNVAWFELPYRMDNRVVMNQGTLDMVSGAFSLSSYDSDYLVDDHEWRTLTNKRMIQFDWKQTN